MIAWGIIDDKFSIMGVSLFYPAHYPPIDEAKSFPMVHDMPSL